MRSVGSRSSSPGRVMPLKCIIFDMDGTIFDVPYDWKKIKADLDTQGKPILAYLADLPEPDKTRKWRVLEDYEDKATQAASLRIGFTDFLKFSRSLAIKTALVTNNSQKNVDILLQRFALDFDLVMSRDSGLVKPSGAPFLAVLERLEVSRDETCVVGDSLFDLKAAQAAAIPKVYLLAEQEEQFAGLEAEVFFSYHELQKKIQLDFLGNNRP